MCYICYEGSRVATETAEATTAASSESSEAATAGESGGIELFAGLTGTGSMALLMFVTLFLTFSVGLNIAVRSFNKFYH